MDPNFWCACGQEAKIVTDRMENGQKNRFCSTCGKSPRPRDLRPIDPMRPAAVPTIYKRTKRLYPWY